MSFRAKEFIAGRGKIAALIAGFAGHITDFEQAIADLQANGYDVVAYEYSNDVLEAGEPEKFAQLVNELGKHFDERAKGYATRRYAGVSFGMALAVNMQKKTHAKTEPGLYAAAGTPIPRLVYGNPFFRHCKRAFKKNGYSEADLEAAWKDLHAPAKVPFVIALSRHDFFAKYKSSRHFLGMWKAAGTPMEILVPRIRGHSNIIKWFNTHIPELLTASDNIEA